MVAHKIYFALEEAVAWLSSQSKEFSQQTSLNNATIEWISCHQTQNSHHCCWWRWGWGLWTSPTAATPCWSSGLSCPGSCCRCPGWGRPDLWLSWPPRSPGTPGRCLSCSPRPSSAASRPPASPHSGARASRWLCFCSAPGAWPRQGRGRPSAEAATSKYPWDPWSLQWRCCYCWSVLVWVSLNLWKIITLSKRSCHKSKVSTEICHL